MVEQALRSYQPLVSSKHCMGGVTRHQSAQLKGLAIHWMSSELCCPLAAANGVCFAQSVVSHRTKGFVRTHAELQSSALWPLSAYLFLLEFLWMLRWPIRLRLNNAEMKNLESA